MNLPLAQSTAVVRGTNDKPAATEALIQAFSEGQWGGHLFIGYPVVLASADGSQPLDAVFLSQRSGLVAFDLVEGNSRAGLEARQDDIYNGLQQRLLSHRDLVSRRKLRVTLTPVTFGPALGVTMEDANAEYALANLQSLPAVLAAIAADDQSSDLYERTLSAIQNISTIRRARVARQITGGDSRAAKLQTLEASIATLDNMQSKAVIETVDGVQRIRGLAGSGKTIVLALKAAYLHATHPDWQIAVTFNTRSLKAQFQKLINGFTIEQTGEEPDWSKVRIVPSWGAPGGPARTGLYYEFCRANEVPYLPFNSAKSTYGQENAFDGACTAALAAAGGGLAPPYDAILVDEAQDQPASFLRLCYAMLDENRRLVYAYDELQTLSGSGMASVDEIFGVGSDGVPLVSFAEGAYDTGARRDIVLEKCYRNSRPVLVTAHALGFGIYRRRTQPDVPGLVQMFDQADLWSDIGYQVKSGDLTPGSPVVLERTENSSPAFLEEHSHTDDLIVFRAFADARTQNEWIANEIATNLTHDGLRYDDIVVINTDPLTTRANLGPIRRLLLDRSISSHLAGVDSSADEFFNSDRDSVTFSGIYRAKGNEAGMVYIVNAHEAQSSALNLARIRNRLFTAITRSKAWVRVVGFGDDMQLLIKEYEAVRSHGFTLDFRYPTDEERAKLQIIHRDADAKQAAGVRKAQGSVSDLIARLESGELYPEDIDADVRRLLDLMQRRQDGLQ